MIQPMMTSVADDERRAPDQHTQRLAAGLRSFRDGRARPSARPAPGATVTSISVSASRRIRGFIQAMVRSAISVAIMYTMPMMRTPGRQHREVLALGREEHRLAHPVVVEDLLDRDDPAEQVADLDRDDGDRRDQRVAQHVAAHRLARRQALHRGGPRVVGLEDVDRPGACHARDVAEVHDGHRHRRHEQVADLRRDVRVRRAAWRGRAAGRAGRRRRRRGSCR